MGKEFKLKDKIWREFARRFEQRHHTKPFRTKQKNYLIEVAIEVIKENKKEDLK